MIPVDRFFDARIMAAKNPQPLRARRPFEDHMQQIPTHIDDDEDGDETEEDVREDDSRRNQGGNHHIEDNVQLLNRTSELTLALEGEVYAFPATSYEKVQAVLLLLGGREIPTTVPTVDVSFHQSNKGAGDAPWRSNLSRRIASLVRFREKRKERCFDKKIWYNVRKEVSQRMHHKKGQFASLKQGHKQGHVAASSLDSSQSGLQDGLPVLMSLSLLILVGTCRKVLKIYLSLLYMRGSRVLLPILPSRKF